MSNVVVDQGHEELLTRGKRRSLRILAGFIAAVTALGGWQFLSWQSDGWVPSLNEIFLAGQGVLESETLFHDFGVTLRRVVAVWLATLFVGVVVGILAGFSATLRAMLRPVIAIAISIPDLVYIILVVLILGSGELAGFVALMIAISPLVVNVVMNGVLERDIKLDEMAVSYRYGIARYLKEVLWRQLKSAIRAGTRTAFAFSWKIMVLVEAITIPDGVGAQIMKAYKFLDPATMIVYAGLFIVLMKIIELAIVDRIVSDSDAKSSS